MKWSQEDVDLDGITDLVFQFKKRDMDFWGNPPENCAEVQLTAALLDGSSVFGLDILCAPGGEICEG